MAKGRKTPSANPTGAFPSLPEQDEPRRSRRNNAGQGGARQQLEKVADVIDQPQQAPRKRTVVPDDVPPNPMAPTPRPVRKPSQKPRKAKSSTKDTITQGSRSGSSVQPAMAAPGTDVSVFSAPEPELCAAVAGSRFGLQVQASGPPSFVGPQSTHDYEQQRIRYQGRPQIGSSSGQHQSGTRNEDAVQGTPVRPRANNHRSYADTLRLPSPPRPMLKAAGTTAPNHAKVGLQSHSTPLSAITEDSSTSASDPTATRLNTDKRITVQVAPEPQGNAVLQRKQSSQCAPGPSRSGDVFGGDSDLSLTSGSETDGELPLVPKPRNVDHEMDDDGERLLVPKPRNVDHEIDDDEPRARESLYETDNEGLYTDDPANMDGQGDDLYFDNDRDVRMNVDPWGDDQEFPSNLDDAIEDSSEDNEERSQDHDKNGQILPEVHQLPPSRETAPLQAGRPPSPPPRVSIPSRSSLTNSRVQRHHLLGQRSSSLKPGVPRNHAPSAPPSQSQQAQRHPPISQGDPLHESQERDQPQGAGSNQRQTTSPRTQRSDRWEPFADGQVNTDHDVVNRHHKRNRRPRSPSPTYLQSVRNGDHPHQKKSKRGARDQDERGSNAGTEQTDGSGSLTLVNKDESRAPSRQGSKYSKTSKADVVARPVTMAFFGPLWCKLLDEGKAKLRLHLMTDDPFPPREMAIDGICTEIIIELVIKYEEEGLELEAGFYPEYGRQMAIILYSDTQTFRSEVKKCVTRSVVDDYHLFPPENLQSEIERIEFVKNKAARLLENAQFLRGAPDSLGKTSNFAHPALKKVCLAYFYSSSDKALRQFPDFQEYIPERALLLVGAMVRFTLETFATHGFNKRVSLNVEQVEGHYTNLCRLLNQVAADKYHGPKLDNMLRQWAKIGMTGYAPNNPILVNSQDWQVVLD
ncbi:hypothetical protein EV363DRAFT_1155703 [Boletus edulis]|nr:hypothetical protein EV363DRAFT_1155703 [Boletus edulis]